MNDHPKTCGSCRHFHLLPRNTADLSQPRQGQCREGPPQVTILPSPQGQMNLVSYPPLPVNYPACGRFLQALAVLEDGR